jgi:hypothetical protein
MKKKLITSLLLLGAALTAHGQYATVGVYDSLSNPNAVDHDESIGGFTYPTTVAFMPTIWSWNLGGTIDFDTPAVSTAPVMSLWATYGSSQSNILQMSFRDPVRRVFLPYAISNFSALQSTNPTRMETYYGPGLRACGFTVLSDPTSAFWAVVYFTQASGTVTTAWRFITPGATTSDTYFSSVGSVADPIVKTEIRTFAMASSGKLIIDDLWFFAN